MKKKLLKELLAKRGLKEVKPFEASMYETDTVGIELKPVKKTRKKKEDK